MTGKALLAAPGALRSAACALLGSLGVEALFAGEAFVE
jgi:hypothetical protein